MLFFLSWFILTYMPLCQKACTSNPFYYCISLQQTSTDLSDFSTEVSFYSEYTSDDTEVKEKSNKTTAENKRVLAVILLSNPVTFSSIFSPEVVKVMKSSTQVEEHELLHLLQVWKKQKWISTSDHKLVLVTVSHSPWNQFRLGRNLDRLLDAAEC